MAPRRPHFDTEIAEVSRLDQAWGSNDLHTLFPGDQPTAVVPWAAAGRRRSRQMYDRDLVADELSRPASPERLVDIDPRMLRATQPAITRSGVDYYMGRQWEQTGQTFADRGNVGNQWPFVYSREGDELLLAGHHRAAASLLRGQPLRARRVEGPWGRPR